MANMVFSAQREENPTPLNPLDGGGAGPGTPGASSSMSFRDKVLGGKKLKQLPVRELEI
ncbi:hypothetical protein SESBI_07183 [Sesbania bispinosa]|nr:hypothetical protein SESBI_07183 [Sesbania bispinosa]